MDWAQVIERNAAALRRIVATLAAMAGIAVDSPAALAHGAAAAPTLPRRLHRAVLRRLRPAEAAVRRLVIVAARGVAVVLAPPRPRRLPPSPAPLLRRLGIAVVVPADAAAPRRPAGRRLRRCLFALVDPLPRRGRRPRPSSTQGVPRVLFADVAPHRVAPPPRPGDPLDATRLGLRLRALAAALDDLPGAALRLARWRALRARRRRGGRAGPLKPGRPPGLPRRRSPRHPAHDAHLVLADLQHFAMAALAAPDTS